MPIPTAVITLLTTLLSTSAALPPATPAPTPPVAPNDRVRAAEPAEVAPGEVEPAQLELVDLPRMRVETGALGDEPRQPLRVTAEVGQRHRVELSMESLRNRFDEDGRRQVERPLPFRTRLLAEVVEVKANGETTVALTVESSVAQPSRLHTIEESAGMRAAARAMEGLRMELRVSELGRVISLRMETPRTEEEEHREAATRQAMRVATALARTIVALPEEPIGVGGRWTTVSSEVFDGIDRTQYGEFALEQIDDGVAVISRRTRVIASSQPGDESLIPLASRVELAHHSGFGQGETVRPLAWVFPRRLADEVICTSMTTGTIAGERIIVNEQIFTRVQAETSEVTEAPRRQVGE